MATATLNIDYKFYVSYPLVTNYKGVTVDRKTCMRCGEERRITSFKMDKRTPDGRTKTCRPCYTHNKLKEPWRPNKEQIESRRKKIVGRKHSLEWRFAISRGQQRAVAEGKHPWKINKDPHRDNDRNRLAYKMFREEVLKNAGYKCELCESTKRLHVHHIKCYYKYPALRLDQTNGQCLCQSCHLKETWKVRKGENASNTK